MWNAFYQLPLASGPVNHCIIPALFFTVNLSLDENYCRPVNQQKNKLNRDETGIRKRSYTFFLFLQDKLPLSFISEKKNDHWSGRAFIPVDYFPPRVTKFNAYAIHGTGNGRTYEALYKVPGDEPDL